MIETSGIGVSSLCCSSSGVLFSSPLESSPSPPSSAADNDFLEHPEKLLAK
jgi:hypothetical protein